MPTRSTGEAALSIILIACALAAAAAFPIAASSRVVYPFEIEWLESELLQHVDRAAAGLPLYAQPSAEFSPTIYPPVYAWTAAQLRGLIPGPKVLPTSFFAPRLLSALSTVLLAALAAIAAFSIGRHAMGAVVAGAIVLSAQVACGTMLDLARLDPFWVLLCLMATTLTAIAARPERAPAWAIAAGLAFAAATATKQPAILFAGAAALALFRSHRRRAVALVVSWLVPAAAFYGFLHVTTAGWSTTYVLFIPLRVQHQAGSLVHFLRDDLLHGYAPAVAIVALWALVRRPSLPGSGLPLVWWSGAVAAAFGTLAMRTLQGGGLNTLLPLLAYGAVMVGGITGRVLRDAEPATRMALLVAASLQLAMQTYNPRALVPGAADRARAEALVERIRAIEGDVWIPSHTSYARLAGKPWLVHRDPLLDLLYSRWDAFPEDLLRRLRDKELGAVIVDGPFIEPELQQALEAGYTSAEAIADPPIPRTGYRTTPATVWRPR